MRKRYVDRLRSNLRRSIEQLTALEGKLPELLRRGEVSARPDGFATGSGDQAVGGRSEGGHSDPTVTAAMRRLGYDPDVVGAWLRALVRGLDKVSRQVNTAAGLSDLIEKGESQRGRQLSVPECVNPHCNDLALPRPVAGRCMRCYDYRRRHAGDDWRPPVEEDTATAS